MHKVVISDTSCFIILSNINELDLLKQVYGKVFTTPEVVLEFGDKLPEWVEPLTAKDTHKQKLLEMQVDLGEASAIALAMEFDNSVIVLDDYKARKIADYLGLKVVGTIGIILKAKQLGHISSIKPILEKISTTNFRISKEIEQEALKLAGEK